jgi:hypothetical protein
MPLVIHLALSVSQPASRTHKANAILVKKSGIGGKQYLDYLWELGELPVYTIGCFGISVSLRYDCPHVIRIRRSSHPCANIQDVVKEDR